MEGINKGGIIIINKDDRRFASFLVVILVTSFLSSFYSFLLFHNLVELTTITIQVVIFIIAWNSRHRQGNALLVFLGMGYLSISGVDLLHTLAYRGMDIFAGYDADLPTQLWIIGRYMEASLFVSASVIVSRSYRPLTLMFATSTIGAVLVVSAFTGLFPSCFIEGAGLTDFKIYSEYLISSLFLISIYLLYRMRDNYSTRIINVLIISIVFKIIGEIFFTFYIDVYGISNLMGHLMRVVSISLLYLAIVETGIRDPYNSIFRDLSVKTQELEHETELLNTYLSTADLIFIVLNSEQKVEMINRLGAELLEVEKSEALGSAFKARFIPKRHATEFDESLNRASNSGMPVNLELDLVNTRNGLRRISFQISAINRADEGRDYLLVGKDITDTQAMLEELRIKDAAISDSINGIAILDHNGDILYCNQSFRDIWGLRPEHVLRRSIKEFLSVDAGKSLPVEDWPKDGTAYPLGPENEVHLRYSLSKVENIGSKCYYMLSVLDVTEQYLAEKALFNANYKLSVLNQITRHDIMNQITIADGYLSLMEDAEEPQKEEFLKRGLDALEAIRKHVEFSRDYQTLGLNAPDWYDPKEVFLDRGSNEVYGNIRIETLGDPLEAEVLADSMFPQVINNLMDNALIHGGDVSRLTMRIGVEGSRLKVEIKDDGQGISPDMKERLFQKGVGKNNGLGLYLCREILSITNLEITEDGEPGRGARFTMRVPASHWRFKSVGD